MDLLIMLFAALLSGDIMALNFGVPHIIIGISIIAKIGIGVVICVKMMS